MNFQTAEEFEMPVPVVASSPDSGLLMMKFFLNPDP
jgi:hypothetical protein